MIRQRLPQLECFWRKNGNFLPLQVNRPPGLAWATAKGRAPLRAEK